MKVIPFKREIRKGDQGPDVLAVKRALLKAKCMTRKRNEKFNMIFGPRLVTGLTKFQHQKNITADGIYGRQTHYKLMSYFDNYGAWLMGEAHEQAAPAITLRGKVLNEALWGYNNRGSIHYDQVRPMRTLHRGHYLPQTLDCSEFATVCYERAGAPDPNGFGYNGYGFTGTLANRGTRVSLENARQGDLVLYGYGWPYTHVAIYAGFGKVISHGSETGPHLLPIDYRSDRKEIRSYL